MKKIQKVQKILLIIMALLVLAIGVYAVLIFIPNKKNVQKLETDKKIKYDYVTYKRDTDVYKQVFDELESVLNKSEIDYNLYAKYISELFIIDFYTLDNKISKNDVGGVQFIKDSIKDNFLLNATDTVYKYIGSDIKNLPVVKSITTESIEESNYTIDKVNYSSYIIKLNWDYVNDLGYDSKATITVIKDSDKLYIVEKNQVYYDRGKSKK